MDARYHLWDDTQATDDSQGSPCAWCILLTPLGLIPCESCFRVIPQGVIGPVSILSIHTRRSKSKISKGNVLGYYRNLGSLRYRNEYCIPGHAMSCTLGLLPSKKFEMRWQAADYIARRPSHFGGLWRAE